MNPKNKVNELFQAIEESSEYKKYLAIYEVIRKNQEVNELVCEIKKLQQESVKLEHKKDKNYLEIDKVINDKKKTLEAIPIYQEYVARMNQLNDLLAESSFQIEKYVNSKI